MLSLYSQNLLPVGDVFKNYVFSLGNCPKSVRINGPVPNSIRENLQSTDKVEMEVLFQLKFNSKGDQKPPINF